MVPVIGGLLWISACTDEADPQIHQNKMVIPGSTSELDNSKSTIKIYAETIISSDYDEMNTLEKQARDMAVKMKKNGANEEKVLSYIETRISLWSIENIEAIESSLLFKSANLNIKDIEIDPLDMETEEEGEVFVIVEEMPEFEGEGLKRFQKWVQQNVKYPEIAIQNGIKGTVFVNFIIDNNGVVSSIKIVRGVDPSLDNEVKRVLESAPSWSPGKQRGEKVKVKMSIPVKFMLE
jgi:TonB family protein